MPPASEHTPLVQTVIVTPARPRYSHSYIRRFCTIALGLSLCVLLLLFLVPGRWPSGTQEEQNWTSAFRSVKAHKLWPSKKAVGLAELEKILLETPSEKKTQEWSQYYTSGPHLAGKNLSQAEWTRDLWQGFGVSANVVAYDVYINYPVSHRLALLESAKTSGATVGNHAGHHYDIKYECKLQEDVLEEDPTSGLDDRIPTFHGYSATGNVTGQFVYVNFGTFWDFQDLVAAAVPLEGKIALAKYGRGFRGLKVRRAEQLGMIGIVMYSDPQEDGEMTELNGHKAYPDGPARNPSSVQRGSVQFLSTCKT